jgi:prevent-host-death family protein
MYGRLVMRRVNVSETRENLAELLTAVEAGEEIIIMRRDRPVAKLVALTKPTSPFLDRSQLRSEIPPMRTTAAQTIRELREEERY